MARRKVFLHIGLASTGAGFVEHALLAHREGLADAGITVPVESTEETYRAAVEVLRQHKARGYKRSEVEGTWAAVCRRIFRNKQTALMSQDLLASADDDQVALLLDGLAGREVHVVITARDPGTQIARGWQDAIRAGDSISLGQFASRVIDPARDTAEAQGWWAAQDLAAILQRWARRVRPGRVHLVVVPPLVDPRAAIWGALGEVVGFDATGLPLTSTRVSQPILGATEVAVMRGVNETIEGRISGRMRRTVVRRYFADRVLGSEPDSLLTSPPEVFESLLEVGELWQKAVADGGYDVRGDLDHLLPPAPETTTGSPDEVTSQEKLHTTTEALADVLVEVARLREHNERLEIRNAKLEKKRKKLKRRLARAEEA